jgi:hypothetical protein
MIVICHQDKRLIHQEKRFIHNVTYGKDTIVAVSSIDESCEYANTYLEAW